MFGLFKKYLPKKSPDEDYEGIVTHHYEGSVMSSEYNVNDPEAYPYHAIWPHGNGKITYTYGDEVVETYEGEFDVGQYSGKGRLVRKGEVFEGTFSENVFVSE